MMLLNEPKNVAENTGRVMIHTFQPGMKSQVSGNLQLWAAIVELP